MFSLAYVILPFAEYRPAGAITCSLARYQRGHRGDVPEDWLRFHDETAHVQELHRASLTFTKGQGLRTEGGNAWYLDVRAIIAEMDRRSLEQWTVRFAEIEPDIAGFVDRYLHTLERHPATGGFGQWLNSQGHWDWWDLGGRFNGVITGYRSNSGRTRSEISSGPSRGREVLGNLEDALGNALGHERSDEINVRTDNNVELVSSLHGEILNSSTLPGALVLPPGSVEEEMRWIANWPEIGPAQTVKWLGLPANAEWRDIVEAVYARFNDHWAAGVAFHH